MRFKEFLKNELSGWKKREVIWLTLACFIITALSIYWKDSVMGIISATTGVACVICTGKGKLSAYIFGLINCLLYAIIAFKARLYGETMLNLIYYAPMQFIGFYLWSKNMNHDTKEVKKTHMKNMERIIWLLILIGLTIIYGYILKLLGDAMPFVDSFTTMASIVAMVVSIKAYSEQWWIWIFVNVFSVYMWWEQFRIGNDSMATLLMWSVYLVNSVIMCIKWEKEVRKNNDSKSKVLMEKKNEI